MTALARAVASAYRRKVWWMETDDMAQVAECAILEAERTFDARVGVPRSAYLRRAAVLAVRASLWKQSAPVSGRGERELRGLFRAPLTDSLPVDGDVGRGVEDKEWKERVSARLEAVAGDDLELRVGLAILLSEEKPREAARRLAVPRTWIYRAVKRTRRAIADDPALFELWMDV